MREIKFRGKRLDNGEWAKGSLKRYDNGACEIMVSGERKITRMIEGKPFYQIHAVSPEVVPSTIGEYISVSDKNNVGIYESDIVSFLWGDKLIKMQIGYEEGQFLAFPINYTEGWPLSIAHFKDRIEVIGNIHDNPELLDGRVD